MAEFATLADIQRMVYSKEVTCQLHIMAPVIDRRSNQLCYAAVLIGLWLFHFGRAAMKMANVDAVLDFMFTNPKDRFGV